MDFESNERDTALEVLTLAKEKGVALEPTLNQEGLFYWDQRWIFLWRKIDGIPATGRPDESEGTLKYNMQGAIKLLPKWLRGTASPCDTTWAEAGRLKNLEAALDLVKAWLLDRKEVDDLPERTILRGGI